LRDLPPLVEERRMQAALRLMMFAAVELDAVARAVGYDSYRTFSRACKRRFDRTPARLKAQVCGGCPAAAEQFASAIH
jgi:AraC-like DNA-binding protein